MRRRRTIIFLTFAFLMFMTFSPHTGGPQTVLSTASPLSPQNQAVPSGNTEDYVDVNTSDVDGSSNLGVQSSFVDQQSAPDATYDTLTESDTGNPYASEWLDVDSHDSTWTGWNKSGTSPYLDAQDQPTNIVYSKQDNDQIGWFGFENTVLAGTINLNISVYCRNVDGAADDSAGVYVDYTGTGAGSLVGIVGQHTGYSYDTIDLGAHSATEVNAFRVYLMMNNVDGASDVFVDHIRVGVNISEVVNFELDREVQWIAASFSEEYEYLCIYTGTLGTEDIRVDVWNGTDWDNLFTDLTPNVWNNISVSTRLNSATFTIRFKGGSETSDTTQDWWEIDSTLLHTWTPSYPPTSEQAPILVNADDTDNMYAQYREYQMTVYVSDQNGYADIDYLEVGLWDDSQTTEFWRFRYDEDTDTFIEEYDSGTVVVLNTIGSSVVVGGYDINATFYFTVDWDHPDVSETDAKCYVIDAQMNDAVDWYEVDFDVETRLDYSITPYVSMDDAGTVDRGDLDETFYIAGAIIYYNSVDDSPPSDQVDVWVSGSEYGSTVGPWIDATLTSGAFQVTCYADDEAGQDTYTVKPVEEGTGSSGTSLYYTTDLTDSYIADQVVVQTTVADDTRVDTNTNSEIRVTLQLAYDGEVVGSGDSVALDGIAMTWDSVNSWWDLSRSQISVGLWKYFVNSSSENGHGITGLNVNSKEVDVIWDRILILTTTTQDGRIDFDTEADIRVTAELEYGTINAAYQHSLVGADTLYMNNVVMSWVGPYFRFQPQFAQVGLWRFYANATGASESSFGITVVNLDGKSVDQIWDRVQVQSYTASDTRVNLSVVVSLNVTLVYDFDNSPVSDGTVTINTMGASHQGAGVWRITDSESSVTSNAYDSVAVSGNAYGLSVVDQNGQSQQVIWDQVTVRGYSVGDSRVNTGSNVNIDVTIEYEYDDTPVTDGIVTVNGISATHLGSGVWRITQSRVTAQDATYDTVACNSNLYGISSVNQNSESQLVIWDSVSITITDPPDQRIDIYQNCSGIVIVIVYNYDGGIYDGTFNLNNTNFVFSTAQKQGYNVTSVNGDDTFGVTAISTFDATWCIWDSLTVLVSSPTDQRININTNASGILLSATYDFDGTPYGGTLNINNTQFVYGTAQRQWYAVTSAGGDDPYGISVIGSSASTYCIWDSLTISISGPTDQRISVNTNASGIIITATHDYDSSPFDGTLMLNDTTYQRSSVGRHWYTVASASGDSYGITVIALNDLTWCIWDQVRVVSYSTDDSRIDIGTACSCHVTLYYEYDSTYVVDGTVGVNGVTAVYSGTNGVWNFGETRATVQAFTYNNVVVSGNALGITAVDQNGQSVNQVWDRVQVQSYSVTDSRVNVDVIVSVDVTVVFDYDNSPVTGGAVTVNGVAASHQGGGVWRITVSNPLVGANTYDAVVVSGNAHAITVVDQNGQSQQVIWDSVSICLTDPVDQWININANASGILVSITYDYDSTPYDGTFTLNNTVFTYTTAQRQGYNVTSVSGDDTYGITAISTFDSTWCIWDSLTITIVDPSDQHINLNANASGILVSAVYDYNSGSYDGSLNLNSTIFSYSTVGRHGYTVLSAAGNDSHGITTIRVNDQTYCIWDQIVVVSYSSDDTRINIGTACSCHVTLYYDYDNSYVTDGTVTVNTVAATYSGAGGIWNFGETRATVQLFTYNSVLVSGNAEGITSVNQNGQSFGQIWDRVQVQSYYVADSRVNVGDTVYVDVTLYYDYDNLPVTDGTVSINTIGASNQGSGVWRISVSESSVVGNTYDTVAVSGNSYGITAVDQNSRAQLVIWDQITVEGYTVVDARVNIDTSVNIDVTLEYAYDSAPMIDGTVTINALSAVHQGAGVWRIVQSRDVAQGVAYSSVGCSGNGHGISSVDQNGQLQLVIWDSLTIMITGPTDQRININQNASGIIATAVYDYDSAPFDGTLTLNNTDFNYATAQKQGYRMLSASGGVHGISAIRLNDQTYCIWDSLTITISDPSDQRVNINANATGIVVTAVYDYDLTAYDGTLALNNTQFSYGTAQKQGYRVASASGGSHGITTIRLNDQTYCIWDSLTITITGPSDQRIDINSNASGIAVSAVYDYDSAQYSGTLNLNDTTFVYSTVGRRWYTVSSAAGNDAYGISAIRINDDTWCTWDQIVVASYSSDDSRIDIGTACSCSVTLRYSYDNTYLVDGTVSVNTMSAVYSGSGGVWDFSETKNTVQQLVYNSVAVSGNTHGITAVNQNGQSLGQIWDRVQVQSYTVSDSRVNVNDIVNVDMTLFYDYDNAPVTGGTVTVNGISATHQGSGVWRITDSKSAVSANIYNSVACTGNTFGITIVDQNGQSKTVVWDRIIVLTYTASDLRDNIGDTVDVSARIQYEYDSTYVTNGTVTINGVPATYSGSGYWTIYPVESVVASNTYNAVSCSGNTHGISSVNQNGQSITVIWDRVQVQGYSVADSRVNIGQLVYIDMTLYYDYDHSPVTNGLVTVNGAIATHQGSGVWRISDSEASVIANMYDTVAASGNTHGITTTSQNGMSQVVIWDQMTVRGYSVLDNRVDINSNVLVDVTLEYEYDDSDVTDGTVTVNGLGATHMGFGVWRVTDTEANVVSNLYNTVMCSGNLHGITGVNQNGQTQLVIWDRVTVRGYSASDTRNNVGSLITVYVILEYEYDDSDVTDGTVTVNGVILTYTGSNGQWSANRVQAAVSSETYDSVVVSGNSQGITSVDQNTQSVTVIWDRVQVQSFSVSDPRVNIGDNVNIDVTLVYDFDNSPLIDGTVTINGFSATNRGSGVWRITDSESSVRDNTYNSVAISGNTLGITVVDQNSQSTVVIWDRIVVLSYSSDDTRINVGTACSCHATIQYAYDGSFVTDGTVTVNGVGAVYSGSAGVWNFGEIKASVQLFTYNSVSASGNTHGITSVNQNGQSQSQIWDRLRVISYSVTDTRCDVNSLQNVTAIVVYEYDSTLFTGSRGTVYLNGSAMVWDSTAYRWSQQRTSSVVRRFVFGVTSITDTYYGLSVFQTTTSPAIIWDALTITITIADSRINVGASASVQASATYAYDGTNYYGSLTLNNTQFSYPTAQRQWYTVSNAAGDGIYGITVIGTNDVDYCIWDSLTILMAGPLDQRININTNASGILVSATYDYDGSSYGGTLVLNSTVFSYPTAQKRGYRVSLAVGDDAFGITVISTNDETYCIWDSLTISITDPSDQRISINENASGIVVTAIYDYDSAPYGGTLNLNDSSYLYVTVARRGYKVASAAGNDAFGITAISVNDETFCIWDQLLVVISADASNPYNGVQASFTLAVTFRYDGLVCTSYRIAVARNNIYWHTFTTANVSLFVDIASDTTNDYNASRVNSESLYGIISFVTNTERVSWSAAPNEVPTNDTAPQLTNADDTNNMYARYKYYSIVTSVSDNDGAWDIDYVELTLYDDGRSQIIWVMRYTASTDSFSVQLGSQYVTLASWSSASKLDQTISIVWQIKIDWDHADLTNVDVRQYVTDGTDNDEDFYEVNWDVETRLEITGLTVEDGSGTNDRGPLDGSFTISGTVRYSESSLNPLSNETDVWVSAAQYGMNVGPWSDLLLVSGSFGVTCYADDAVGQDTYTVVAVEEGGGSGGTNLLQNAVQDTYIADQVQVQSYSVLDARVNVGDNVNIDVTLYYDYDNTPVTDGTVTVNGISATHRGGGVWRVTDSESTVTTNTYNTVVFSGGTHGIDVSDQSGKSQSVIWDQVTVRAYSVADNRVSISDSVDIDATIEYEYDDTPVGDGTVTINGVAAAHRGGGVWRIAQSRSSVQSVVFNTVACSGNTLGISSVNQDGKSQAVIWDRIQVQSYSVADARVNVNTVVSIDVTLYYDYDDTPVTDGTVTVNGISAAHRGGGVWRTTDSESTVTANPYNSVACTGNSLGITVVDQNSRSQQVIWDQITVRGYTASDARANVNGNVNIDVTLQFEYDDTSVTDGTVTINGMSAAHQGAGVWRITDSESTIVQNLYNLVACSGNLHGITSVNQNSQTQTVIWDRVIVISYSSDDSRVNINTASIDHVSLRYEYDLALVTDGAVTVNGVVAGYSGANGVWNFGEVKASAQAVVYSTVAVSGNFYGITVVNQNAKSLQQIWDSLTISVADPFDQRINVNENASGIRVTAIYDFDSTSFDGVLLLNQTTYQFSTVGRRGYRVANALGGTHGITAIRANDATYAIWDSLTISISVSDNRISVGSNASIFVSAVYDYDGLTFDGTLTLNDMTFLYSTVGLRSYTVVSASGDTHGITVIRLNDVESIIWDRLRVTGYSVSDSRCNLGTTQTIAAVIIYEYDDVVFTGARGTAYLNGTSMTWDSVDYRWEQQSSSPTVRRLVFVVTSITDTFHGLNVFTTGSGPTIIWDSLTVTVTIVDSRINVGASASIQVSAVYNYDGATYGGTFSLNNTQLAYAVAQKQGYTVSTANGDDTFGITAIGTNDEAYCIWDSLTIWIGNPTDQRININTNASGMTVSATYDYDGASYTGTLVLNNTVFQYSVAQRKGYTVSAALGNDAFGITVISTNDATYCIWDSLTIYISNPTDQRISINTNASGIFVSAVYDYDSSAFDGVLLLNDTTFDHSFVGRYGYKVASASGGVYGISVISTNDETYCIFDRLLVTIGVDDATPYNDHQANFTLSVVFAYDSTQCTTYRVLIGRNGTHWRSFTNTNKSLFVDTNADDMYQYAATSIAIESLHGITAFTTNTLQVTWSIAPNNSPTNDSEPDITNADDTDNLYARYRFYVIVSSVTDFDGFADIDFVELSLYDNTRSLLVWTIRYTVSSDSFSVEQGTEYVALATWSNASSRSFGFDISWVIKIDWDHPDLSNVDIRQYVTDGSDSDEDFYEANWDVETRLNYAIVPALSDDRGDVSTSNLWARSTVIYYGSSSLHPLANETDVWVVHDLTGAWSANVDGSGQFTVTSIGSSTSVRLNSYTFKVVMEGTGAGGSDLYYTTSATDTFVTDRIELYLSGVDDSRININTQGLVYWGARYDYDNVVVSSGLIVSLNGSKALSWNGTYWTYTELQGSVRKVGYAVASAVETTFGLNSWIQTAGSPSILWDCIVVRTTVVDDNRVSVDEDVEVRATLWLEYDHTFLGPGDAVILDGLAMTWDAANSWFDLSRSQSGVGRWKYYVNASTGSTYGITALSLNGNSVDVIWDRIAVYTISVNDGRVSIGSSVEVRVRLWLEYDHSSLGAGDSVSLDGVLMTWDSVSLWFDLARTQSSVGKWVYSVNASTETTYGISALNLDGMNVACIWDQVLVVSYTSDDQRVNIGSACSCHVTLVYSYDGTYVTDGSVTVEGVASVYSGANGVWNFAEVRAGVQLVTYDTVLASGNTYGINSVNQNAQSLGQVWDRVLVVSYSVADSRINVDDVVTIEATLIYDYDNAPMTDGTVTVNTIGATHQGSGVWRFTDSEPSVTSRIYNNVAVSGNAFGISQVSQNGQSLTVTWDQITVRGYSATDSRVNLNVVVNIYVNLEYEYDDADVSDGTVTINGVSATYTGSGFWRIAASQSSVTSSTYDLIACTGNAHGISSVNQNLQSQVVTWDRVVVIGYTTDDSRVNIYGNANVDVTIEYEYDGASIVDGNVWINGVLSSHLGMGVWRITVTQSSVTAITYNTVSCSDNFHGISLVNQNAQSQQVVWDRIRILTTTAADSRIDIGTATLVLVTAQLEYDGHLLGNGDTLYSNGALMAWIVDHFEIVTGTYGSVGRRVYFVNSTGAHEATYGITSVYLDGRTAAIIWDRIAVQTVAADDTRVDIGDDVEIRATLWLEYDLTPLGAGDVVVLDGAAMTWDSANSWFELTRSHATVGRWTYNVNASSEATYAITVLRPGGESVSIIWDRIVVRTISVDDGRTNVGSSSEIRVTLWLQYDSSLLGAGDTVTVDGTILTWDPVNSWFETSKSQATVGRWRYHVNASMESAYGITALDLNGSSVDVIWDRIRVVSYESSDDRNNVGSFIWVNVTVHYEYDDSPLADGTLSVNGRVFNNLENGIWQHNLTEMSAMARTFDSVTCAGNAHLITVVNQDSKSLSVIWDSITVSFVIPDHRVNVGDNASIHVTAVYNYDGTPYGGILTLNDTTYAHGTVGRWAYTVATAVDDSYGITVIGTNDEDYVIWDRLRVLSYAVSDGRCDIGTTQSVYVTLDYEFDSTVFTGALGTVYLNDTSMTWDQAFLRWYQDRTYMTTGERHFRVTGVTDTLHGLTVINEQAAPASVIWDTIEVVLGADALLVNWHTRVNFTLTATREYDGSQVHLLTVSVSRNGSAFVVGNFSDVWNGPVDAVWVYAVTGARDDQYALQVFSANSLKVTWTERPVVVVDRAIVSDIDGRTNIGTVVTIFFHCEWSTNGTAIDSGTLFVNMTGHAVNASGWVEFTWSSASVMHLVWRVTGVDVNGVSLYDQRVASPSMIWDSLKVRITVLDDRISVGENATIWLSATYEWDGRPFDGVLSLNSTTYLYLATSSHAYTVAAAFGGSYGITVIGTNDVALVIWDRILVLSYVTDGRCDVGTTQRVSLSAVYEYDGVVLTGARGLVYLNGTPMSWSPVAQRWFLDVTSAVENRLSFIVSDIDDFAKGLTAFDSGVPASIVWDSLVISIMTGDQRINIGENASVYVSAHYTFDSMKYDGTLLLNDTTFLVGVVGRRGYTVVSAFGDTFGITVIKTNDADYIVWDALTVTIVVADNRINIGENATIWVSAIYAYDGTPYDGVITLNDTTYQYSTVGRRGYIAAFAIGGAHSITTIDSSSMNYVIWDSVEVFMINYDHRLNVGGNASLVVYGRYKFDGAPYGGVLVLNDTVFRQNYVGKRGYTCAYACNDTLCNITVISRNALGRTIWDSITVTITIGDNHISLRENASIWVTGIYDYDGTRYDGILKLNDTVFSHNSVGRWAYRVSSAGGGSFGISAISTNDVDYLIWDQLEVYWSESQRTRADIGNAVDVMFRVRRGYGGSAFTDDDGLIYIDGSEAAFLASEGYWYITVTASEVVTHTYSVTGSIDLIEGIEAMDGENLFTCTTTWDQIYVSRAGVWGSAPAFVPDIESPAGRVLQCELDWTVTVYFHLNYVSDGLALSDPNATLIVNGQRAFFVAERQRWELNVTSSGIGLTQYVIQEIRDSYGLTQVDHRGLYPVIDWYPVRLIMNAAIYGGLGLIGVGAALFIRRTRRRVAVLEKALGPERVLSIDEAELPQKIRNEILASLEWLRDLQGQIPSLDASILLSVKEELQNAHDMYIKAFGDILHEEGLADAGLKLKQALVKRVDVLIQIVERELKARA